MNKWKRKRKKWIDNHSKQYKRKKDHYKSVEKRRDTRNVKIEYKKDSPPKITLTPPESFSILDNAEETMNFYSSFVNELKTQQKGAIFWIDSSQVEHVTTDALIYLIAILQNKMFNIKNQYKFSGNYPMNEYANRVYQESGFNNYVRSNMRKLPSSTKSMRIVGGEKNDSEVAKEFCDFVIKSLGKTRVEMMPLQTVLIELMSNVYHHAYEVNAFMAKKWYMFAEHIDDYVRFIFVDTGKGIASTVRKNFSEQIRTAIGIRPKDSFLIESAFKGEFRTATKATYRGNGLNHVKKRVMQGPFTQFEVYSGKGTVRFNIEDRQLTLEKCEYKNMLYGTLYAFTIR